ncbi:MAG: NADH:flavin oxidoreductase/NADH oxidase [Pseudomonadota bacterium]
MSKLFSPIALRDVELPGRIVVSPMCQYVAEDGLMNDWHLMHLGQLSMGAAHLLFTEATHISAEGRISPGCAGLWNDEQEAAMQRIAGFCHQHGTATMGIQLAHAGRKASCNTPLNGSAPLTGVQGAWQTLGPSATGFAPDWHVPQEMDRETMTRVKQEFVDAATRADRAGYDVFDLHGGHGYLLNQFFSPLSNLRTDEYGGDVEKRIRYPMEVFEAVRAALPSGKPLGIRISATDWVDGGTTVEDTVAFAKALESAGCDFIDITTGGVDHRQKITTAPGYQVEFASAVKKEVGMPIMAVGMIFEPRQAEEVIADGHADFVMLARGVMHNPRWAWHAAIELGVEMDYPPQYLRCSPGLWRPASGQWDT